MKSKRLSVSKNKTRLTTDLTMKKLVNSVRYANYMITNEENHTEDED
jgi:hypothetical protein